MNTFEFLAAVEAGELFLEYQPIVNVASGKVDRVEALVRWTHPLHGVLQPGQFLGLVAHSGPADLLTEFVVHGALEQHRAWADVGLHLPVAVNVSPLCLRAERLVPVIDDALVAYGVDAADLTVEVTEGRTDASETGVRCCLTELARLGVRISMDDFGTGESSLGRLQAWQFDEVKLDRRFVTNVGRDASDRKIVEFAVGLIHELGMTVTAEGVEDIAGLRALQNIGADHAQGFFLARPLDSAGAATTAERCIQPVSVGRTHAGLTVAPR